MARRRDDAAAPAGTPPAWLLLCDPARWVQLDDVPPPDWAFGDGMYRRICADQRWRQSGRDWLAEHGRDPREWFQLTRAGRRGDGAAA